MRHLLAAVAAALSLAACGSATATPAPTITVPHTPATTAAAASPCAAAAAIVAPFRDRTQAAQFDEPAALKRQIKTLSADASAAFGSPEWKTAFAECKAGGERGDVGELMMWNVDISLAALDLENGTKPAASIVRDLAARLDNAVTINPR